MQFFVNFMIPAPCKKRYSTHIWCWCSKPRTWSRNKRASEKLFECRVRAILYSTVKCVKCTPHVLWKLITVTMKWTISQQNMCNQESGQEKAEKCWMGLIGIMEFGPSLWIISGKLGSIKICERVGKRALAVSNESCERTRNEVFGRRETVNTLGVKKYKQ